MTSRFKKTKTNGQIEHGSVLIIDTGEISCRFIEELTDFKRARGESIPDFMERCLDEDASLQALLDLGRVAGDYLREQIEAINMMKGSPIPDTSEAAQ